MNVRVKTVLDAVKDFVNTNKKYVICFSVVFAIGLVIGIVTTVNANGGEFERVLEKDMTFGAVKVFFFSSLILVGGYGVFILSASVKWAFVVAPVTFAVLGVYFGKYCCVLIGCFGGIGVINLIFVYIPFFILTFICMLVTVVLALQYAAYCECAKSPLRPSITVILKGYGVNIVVNFVIFLFIGAITKVLVIGG